jgi:hypothetical protein
MKIGIQVLFGFTVTAALTAIASYPAIARAATFRRSYAAHQCSGPSLVYTKSGAEVGNQGGAIAFCPLINDTSLLLNATTPPTVHLNGTFSLTGDQMLVEACSLSSSVANCGTTLTPSNSSAPQQLTFMDLTAWTGQPDTAGYFLYVNVSVPGFQGNTAELLSYDSSSN